MIIDERQNKILNLLSEKKFISYKELSKLLYSSTSTIRRDVSKMHSQGLLVMVKGGVTGVNTNATESSRSLRELEGTIEKRKIASLANKYLIDGESYFFDSSTTVGQLVYYLKNFRNTTIVTNSLDTAFNLILTTDIDVYLTGGLITKKTNSTTGYFTIGMTKEFNLDALFFSCKGLSSDGFITEANVDTQKCKYEMLVNAKKKILLIDHTKFNKSYLFRTCSLNDIDIVITDKEPPLEVMELFKKSGVKLIY